MGFISTLIYLIFLPFRWLIYLIVVKGFHYILQTLGFTIGLLGGLVAGYFIFIHKLPTAVEEPEVKELIPEGTTPEEEDLQRYYSYLPPWVSNPDYERVDWMNKLIAEMWPYLNRAISEQIREQATPMLKGQKPAFLETLEFQELDLGTIPPAVIGIKSFDTKDDEVILQVALRWAANPNITVAASAKGVTGTVQIIDLQLSAVTRITLKPLIPIFPCFSTITVSFMDKPLVDFGLKVLGLDVMAIPGLYTFVQKTISNTVAGMYMWPKVLEVYDDQPLAPIGWLVITHIKGTKLRNQGGMLSKSDPYLRFSMDGRTLGRRITSVKKDELDPDWGKEEILIRVADLEKQKLHVEVFDKSFSGKADKLMSVTQVSLASIKEDAPTHFESRLVARFGDLDPASQSVSKKDLGSIAFDMKLRPFAKGEEAVPDDVEIEVFPSWLKVGGGRLRMILREGDNLESNKHANPYVVLRFRSQEWQSKVHKKAAELTFDEDDKWELLLDEPPSRDVLHVKVYSKNMSTLSISSKDAIGYCDIKLADVVTNGRINDFYMLADSPKNGRIKIELQWHERTAESTVVNEPPPANRVQ
ncbi:hypothetical protein CLOM_g11785 [Closterium sp. NIES-68]|nr:hypothetical protein CLOM_g11785 [Closterium sp. NIES-68]GJP82137.1 hypothetical protein CLOP_g12354 [Closterium sp. NIES-67]